jgi:hypothetical protein
MRCAHKMDEITQRACVSIFQRKFARALPATVRSQQCQKRLVNWQDHRATEQLLMVSKRKAPFRCIWTEVYADSSALIFHLENPPLQKYLNDVSPLLDSFTVELYGSVSAEAVQMLRATGTPTTHYETKFGYIRSLRP